MSAAEMIHWALASIGILIAAAGLVVPGFLGATILGAPNRWLWAFPLSLLAIFCVVFAVGLLGLSVTGTVMGPVLAGGCLVMGAFAWRIKVRSEGIATDWSGQNLGGRTRFWILVLLSLITAAVVVRSILWPLSGADTPTRWNFLAIQMLGQHSFAFYPPMSASDYRVYFYTDGIPPLVSFSYWWLYAMTGGAHPSLTALSVGLQFVTILFFVYRIGRNLE